MKPTIVIQLVARLVVATPDAVGTSDGLALVQIVNL